jgi:ferric-dicitrate binding protein FerR (iron transport regulator)
VKTLIPLACAAFASVLSIEIAAAQTSSTGCSTVSQTTTAQTLHCEGGITIVAENGARYSLKDTHHDGRIDTVDLGSKALLLEVPKQPRDRTFQVTTPQAIAAVRGTKWAVDATDDKTSVFVAKGRVSVGRTGGAGQRAVLGPGEGVDVGSSGPLIVKKWASARVDALMARLGQ